MEIIKPVIFINDEVEASEDINTVFTLPQRLKFIADNMKSVLSEDMKGGNIDPEFYRNWSIRYTNEQASIKYKTVTSYIMMNTCELFRMNILTFLQRYFDKYYKNKYNLYNFHYVINNFRNNVHVGNIILQCENRLNHIISTQSLTIQDKKKLAFLSLEQISDIMCNEITVLYIDFVNTKIMELIGSKSLHNIYQDIYQEVYNEKPSTYNIDYVYTFLSTMLHSEVEEEIKKIRNALSLVMSNAAQMFLDLSYGDRVVAENYKHEDYLEDMSDVEFIEGGIEES